MWYCGCAAARGPLLRLQAAFFRFGTPSSDVLSRVALVQVVIPLAANISRDGSTLFTCPTASTFNDAFGGLYGVNGSYDALYPAPWNAVGGTAVKPCPYKTSTLQFGCAACAIGTYSLSGDTCSGAPGAHGNISCLACPFGGACSNGSVVAAPGYWGAGDARVSFTVCPVGYCCTGSADSPCASMRSCAGYRTGQLCGDCSPGYTEGVGSSSCVAEHHCKHDKYVFWPLLVAGVFLSAALLLLVASDVLIPRFTYLNSRVKSIVYFFQVRLASLLCVALWWSRQ